MKMQNNNLTLEELRDLCDKLIAAKSPHARTNLSEERLRFCPDSVMSVAFEAERPLADARKDVEKALDDCSRKVWKDLVAYRKEIQGQRLIIEKELAELPKDLSAKGIDMFDNPAIYAAMDAISDVESRLEAYGEDFHPEIDLDAIFGDE